MRLKYLLFLVLLLAPTALSWKTIFVPAVNAEGEGVLASIDGQVLYPGRGDSFISVVPYTSIKTQDSEKAAAESGARMAGVNRSEYDLVFKIHTDAELVDGPSAGLAMALLTYSLFKNVEPRQDMAVTGAIDYNGRAGQVGGVVEKLAALKGKISLFLVPKGQSLEEGVDLVEYGREQFGIQVIEVAGISDAVQYAFTLEGSTLEAPERAFKPLEMEPFPASTKTLAMKRISSGMISGVEADLNAFKSSNDTSAERYFALTQLLNDSKYLLERNYFYSAANNAFLLKIRLDAYSQKGLSEEEIRERINALLSKASEMEFPRKNIANWEWVAAAQMRVEWLVSEGTAIASDPEATKDDLLVSYASMLNWYNAAESMNREASLLSADKLNELVLRDYALSLLEEAGRVAELSKDDEAIRHHDYAAEEFKSAEYVACIYDSLFAREFGQAAIDAENLSFDGMRAEIAERTSFRSIWGEIYYAHALYQLEQAERSSSNIYVDNAFKLNRLAVALEEINSAIATESPPESVYEEAERKAGRTTPIPTLATVSPAPENASGLQTNVTVSVEKGFSPQGIAFLAMVVLAIGVIVLFVGGMLLIRSRRNMDPEAVLNRKLKALDEMLVSGRISEANYNALKQKYLAELEAVRGKQEKTPHPLLPPISRESREKPPKVGEKKSEALKRFEARISGGVRKPRARG